jgi:DHA1 family 2-module integral membrane pump EmrD-like MFS transporter
MSDYKVTWADFKFILPLLVMGVLAQFGSDNYLPSYPILSQYFDVSNTMIKWSMSAYLVGMGSCQLIFGPLSDYIGRKPVFAFGFLVFAVGGIVCALSHTIASFLLGRFIQGAGMGAGMALYRAIMRDCFSGNKLAKVSAIVVMCVGLTPPLAPITGGYIQHYFNWQMNFYLMSFIGVVYLVFMTLYFPETSPKSLAGKQWFPLVRANAKRALSTPVFTVNLIRSGLSYASIITYLTMSPYLFQDVMHMNPVDYGWTNIVNAAGFLVGGTINACLIGRFSVNQLMSVGVISIVIGAFLLVITGVFQWVAPLPVLFSVFIAFMGCGFMFSNASAAALQPFPDSAGLVGAIFGCFQVLIAALASVVAGFIYVHNQEYIGIVMLSFGLIMLVLRRVYH